MFLTSKTARLPQNQVETKPIVNRRQLLSIAAAGLCPLAAAANPAATEPTADNSQIAALLRSGACILLMRHATTVSGIGDPPNFKLGVCSTQRNLSDAGKQESQRIGAWFAAQNLQPRSVLSSAWCRCQDTAQLAFGRHSVWPVLNSTFNDRTLQPDQTRQMTQALARLPSGQFEVWVTHQVNITALTGQTVGMGEAVVVDRKAQVLGQPSWRL